jgi:3-oxoadipate enol-lactonase
LRVDDDPSSEEVRARWRGRRTGRLRVQGAEIHYEVCGQGPAIVFAHGLGGSHLSWWQQVAHFSRHHTCVTFSYCGFGSSSADAGQPDPACFADDLEALIAHLKIGQAHLVGQSMGGWTVAEYGLRHPQRVRSLVLSATTGSIDPSLSAGFDLAAFERWRLQAEETAQRCRAAGVHPAAGMRMAREQPALHLLFQQMDELSPALDKPALRSRLRALQVREPCALAAKRLPVLLVSPQEDIVMSPLALWTLASALAGARLVELPDTGHSAYFEAAQVFNRHLDEFIQDIDHREVQQVHTGLGAGAASPRESSAP